MPPERQNTLADLTKAKSPVANPKWAVGLERNTHKNLVRVIAGVTEPQLTGANLNTLYLIDVNSGTLGNARLPEDDDLAGLYAL